MWPGERQLEAGWIRTWTTGHHTGLFKALLVQASTVSSRFEAVEGIISFLREASCTKGLDCRDPPKKTINIYSENMALVTVCVGMFSRLAACHIA